MHVSRLARLLYLLQLGTFLARLDLDGLILALMLLNIWMSTSVSLTFVNQDELVARDLDNIAA